MPDATAPLDDYRWLTGPEAEPLAGRAGGARPGPVAVAARSAKGALGRQGPG